MTGRGGRVKSRKGKAPRRLLSALLAAVLLAAAWSGAVAAFGLIELSLHPIRYSSLVNFYAESYGVPKELVYAVILTESRFRPNAVSRAGAAGLMQLMPETYRETAEKLGRVPDPDAVFEPGMNLCCGIFLLSELYAKYRDWELACAAYNAGETAVDRWLADPTLSEGGRLTHIPYRETAEYVKKVREAAEAYRKLYGFSTGGEDSPSE